MTGKAKAPKAHRKPATETEREELEDPLDLDAIYELEGLQGVMEALDGEDHEEEVLEEELKELEEYERRRRQGPALADTAFWLDQSDPSWPWYLALEDIDKRGDKTALLKLLRSGEMPATIGHHLADLLERYQLRRRPGRQRTPSYDRSDSEAVLLIAIDEVRARVKKGMKVSDAITEVAKGYTWCRLSEDTLALAYAGQLGNMRRIGKRSAQR